jgi:hypothetical protein
MIDLLVCVCVLLFLCNLLFQNFFFGTKWCLSDFSRTDFLVPFRFRDRLFRYISLNIGWCHIPHPPNVGHWKWHLAMHIPGHQNCLPWLSKGVWFDRSQQTFGVFHSHRRTASVGELVHILTARQIANNMISRCAIWHENDQRRSSHK